ncbi:hypothetical protein GN958_ATG11555 [Phytophthora infestans]|uniref:BZIP transcription factor n=1 Tax=Phytophthora infestans TaxID=4787 RepID=A0A8S9UDR4_PHYIN|nr:hypothetical protein GN958_ATG11555 [Phytophthora infestans]
MKTTDASMGAVLSPSIAELIGQSGSSISENIKGANSFLTPELQHAIVADALKKKIRHRERCRINQARYRQRQVQVETDIEDAIDKLKSEIKQLENKTYSETRQPTAPTSWALASDYFRQLNYYVSSPEKLYKSAFKFIHEFMAPGAEDSSSFEADEWLKNWRLSATYFEDVHMEVKGMKTPTSDTLIAGTTTSMTITSNTLRLAFPHLNRDGVGGTKGGAWSPLASKLLGKRLVMCGSVIFRWDSSTGKAMSIHSQADMITPMIKLLGTLEDVSNAFYKARVTPDDNFTRC